MYFEASGEDGGEVKLVTKGPSSGVMTAAEPSSACSGVLNTPGARLSLAGSQEHQKKTVETLQVRSLLLHETGVHSCCIIAG